MRKLRNSELNRLSVQGFKEAAKLPIRVVLDDVRSHHNVGSIFRTCDAFRVNELVLGGITPIPPHQEIEKTALGATRSVVWVAQPNLALFLKDNPYGTLIALEHTSKSELLGSLEILAGPITLVFGNEVKGVSDEVLSLCDKVIEIPQLGTKHSFNVSVSVGIALWEFVQSFK
jgi:tRNA G18 (ribose-2'-O)-methylase SpoU